MVELAGTQELRDLFCTSTMFALDAIELILLGRSLPLSKPDNLVPIRS